MAEFVELLHGYGIKEVFGDRFSGGWCASEFERHHIKYKPSDQSKSEIYLACLPMLLAGKALLLDVERLRRQFGELSAACTPAIARALTIAVAGMTTSPTSWPAPGARREEEAAGLHQRLSDWPGRSAASSRAASRPRPPLCTRKRSWPRDNPRGGARSQEHNPGAAEGSKLMSTLSPGAICTVRSFSTRLWVAKNRCPITAENSTAGAWCASRSITEDDAPIRPALPVSVT